jgi:hypothetical protein
VIYHIDLSSVLRHSVHALYSNLVTRPTGVAVRCEIENLVAEYPGRTLTVIDFTHVGLLDYSCADEVVAKLVLEVDGYFVFRGLDESHLDAIEAALSRYDLALVVEPRNSPATLIGCIDEPHRTAWQMVHHWGRADACTLAQSLGTAQPVAERLLDTLSTRRLLVRVESVYLPIGSLQ